MMLPQCLAKRNTASPALSLAGPHTPQLTNALQEFDLTAKAGNRETKMPIFASSIGTSCVYSSLTTSLFVSPKQFAQTKCFQTRQANFQLHGTCDLLAEVFCRLVLKN